MHGPQFAGRAIKQVLRDFITSRQLDRPVIVAVVAMWMVQVAVDEIVDMVTVRHGFVAAAGAVDVSLLMT